jgi:hypothetical protein
MSSLIVSNVSDGTLSIPTTYVTNGSAKAWVNFNGTGTIAARDSLNLSSLTDNGAGDYTVNFSNVFSTANYSATVSASQSDGSVGLNDGSQPFDWNSDNVRIGTFGSGGTSTKEDLVYINATIHGGLA